MLFDAPARLQTGLFWGYEPTCPGASYCGQPIGSVYQQIIAAQQAFQAATLAAGPAANRRLHREHSQRRPGQWHWILFAPELPHAIFHPAQWRHPARVSAGNRVERRLLAEPGLHYLVYYDTNHVGAARYLDKNAAASAISTTLANCGVATIERPSVTARRSPWTRDPNYASYVPRPASISDFATNGLDSALLTTFRLWMGLPPALPSRALTRIWARTKCFRPSGTRPTTGWMSH